MATTTWKIDPAHTRVGFTVRHMVVSKVHGRFTRFEGAIELDEGALERSSVNVKIEAASIDTSEPQRDGHLRSPDFLDAEHFPALTFKSKRVEKDGDELKVIGDLTIRDVTHEVTLTGELLGRNKDPWGAERIGFSARTRINRGDFGLKWNQVLEAGGVLVAEKVDIELDVEAVKG